MKDTAIELRDTELFLLLQAAILTEGKIPSNQMVKLRRFIPDLGACQRNLTALGLVHCWRVGAGFSGPNREPHLALTDAGYALVRTIVITAREIALEGSNQS